MTTNLSNPVANELFGRIICYYQFFFLSLQMHYGINSAPGKQCYIQDMWVNRIVSKILIGIEVALFFSPNLKR